MNTSQTNNRLEPDVSVLHAMSDLVLSEVRTKGVGALFEPLGDYHDFQKSRLRPGLIERILNPFSLTDNDVQIEFAVVPRDLSHQVHIHSNSFAVASVLGAAEGLDGPREAFYYLSTLGELWLPITPGMRLEVPPLVKHGFALNDGGICYFLTIQSPPTDRTDHDDFVKMLGPQFMRSDNKPLDRTGIQSDH